MYNSNLESKQTSDNEDQNTDQGFIENKILIQKDKKKPNQNLDNQRPTDFATRFIRGELILKNQPQQLFDTKKVWQGKIGSHHTIRKVSRKYKQPILTLQEYYFKSRQFKLIYSKHKEKIQLNLEKDMTEFYLTMQYIMDYKLSNYSIIKPYKSSEFKQEVDGLIFDSKFQSGNLIYAFVHKNTQQYHLMIQNDVNTKGYNQWFYFSVQNAKPNKKYTIKIINFKKRQSLFSEGMKPLQFSIKAYKLNGIGWSRNFQNIKFEKTNVCKNQYDHNLYYALEFTLETSYSDDQIFISMGMPYSYSKLNYFLNQIDIQAVKKPFLSYKKQIISYTLCNNAVPLITITSNTNSDKKKHIGFMARQHPGETWSSYLLQQIIKALMQDNPIAQYLRNNFVFKIFPMINIDGVIYGNFRCDVSGVDLNRQWKSPHKYLHPHIHDIKNYITQSCQLNNYELFFDLHGHSKKLNTFCYSCQKDPQTCRIFPLIMQKFYSPFYFPDCTFGISKEKQNTARAFLFNIIKKDNILTIQLSFYGTDKLNNVIQAFNPQMMADFSVAILKSIYTFDNNSELQGVSRETISKQIKNRIYQFRQYDKKNQNDSGSQSDPYQDQIQQEKLKKILPIKMRVVIQLEQKLKKKSPNKKKNKGQLNKLKKKSMLKQLKIDKKFITLSEKKNDIQDIDPSQIKKKQELQELKQNSKSRAVSKKKNEAQELQSILSKIQPKVITVKKDIHHNKKLQFNQTVYKQLNFYHPIESKQPKHNRNTSLPKQNHYKYRSRDDDSPKKNQKSTESEDQNMAKKIQQNMIPVYHQRMTMYQVKPTKVLKPRMAVLHQSIQQNNKYPLIMGIIPSVKRILQRQEQRKNQWSYQSNHIFPIKVNQKQQEGTNLEKFKKKSEIERSKYGEITKIWKQNLEKYSKKLQNQFCTLEFK